MTTKNTETKTASNFELNVIKLGIHTFHLKKGDHFETNGSYFDYCPSTKENKGKGHRVRYAGRSNNHSAKKYMKDVLRADNIELVEDRSLYSGTEEELAAEIESRKAENWKPSRFKVYEVKYSYNVEIPKNEKMLILSVEMGGRYSDDESDKQWTFKSQEVEVKRVTNENLFLTKSHPIDYGTQLPKKEMNIVRYQSDVYYINCMMEDYNEMEVKLFKYAEDALLKKIESGHDIVRRETNNLGKFLLLKTKQGY